MNFPLFDPAAFGTMLISGLIGFCLGLLASWVGHVFASRRDIKREKLVELRYRRQVLNELIERVEKERSMAAAKGHQERLGPNSTASRIQNMKREIEDIDKEIGKLVGISKIA